MVDSVHSHEFTVAELDEPLGVSWAVPGDYIKLKLRRDEISWTLTSKVASKTNIAWAVCEKALASHGGGELRWLLTREGYLFVFEEAGIADHVAKQELSIYLKERESS